MNSYKDKNHNKNINNNTKTTSIFLGCDSIKINLVLRVFGIQNNLLDLIVKEFFMSLKILGKK